MPCSYPKNVPDMAYTGTKKSSWPGSVVNYPAYHKINTEEQKQYWIRSLYDWDVKYCEFNKELSVSPETGKTWYKHKMIRRVRRLLINALPDMFHYLEDCKIPKSTNALESFFGHLKDNLSIHRGLTKRNRKNFIKWYLHLRNKSI